jgi:hypothetical protein
LPFAVGTRVDWRGLFPPELSLTHTPNLWQEDLHPWDATPPGQLGPRQRAVACLVLFALLTPLLGLWARSRLLAWVAPPVNFKHPFEIPVEC